MDSSCNPRKKATCFKASAIKSSVDNDNDNDNDNDVDDDDDDVSTTTDDSVGRFVREAMLRAGNTFS
jgi:hypothetical protein